MRGQVDSDQDHIIDRLVEVVEEFRKFDPEMPAQTMLTFLVIARSPGVRIRDLEAKLGLGSSTVSRNVYALSEARGPDLVEAVADPSDRRAKMVRLTKRGCRVLASLRSILGSG